MELLSIVRSLCMTHTLLPSVVCQSLSGYKNDIAVNSEISLSFSETIPCC